MCIGRSGAYSSISWELYREGSNFGPMAKLGRPRNFETPQELWEQFENYKIDILLNPILIQKWVGKDAKEVKEKHYEPPTWKGFEAYLFSEGMAVNLDRYRRNVDRAYEDFIGIIRAIGADMYRRKFFGASVGIYQHNIIARELGLAEVQEVTNFERPILEGGKELPKEE
jgi:hypothetical protein